MAAFPANLAKAVTDRWGNLVAGDYVAPPCPPRSRLKALLDACYLAASSPEEGRYPQFNVIGSPHGDADPADIEGIWRFSQPRPLTVEELRRLAPAVDLRKSAIWATWDEKCWWISGLIDLGTSWHRARVGLEYRYQAPGRLLVQIDRPGSMTVYQGSFRVASLVDGNIRRGESFDVHLFLHPACEAGLRKLSDEIEPPAQEEPRETGVFEFIALWNTYAAIANSISLQGHGGMLIIAGNDIEDLQERIRIKYASDGSVLRDKFLRFMNARHQSADSLALLESGMLSGQNRPATEGFYHKAELAQIDAYDALVEATRFVARLAGCDGAIIVSNDLRLLGFGGEIKTELAPGTPVRSVRQEAPRRHVKCEIDQFGMRHRSAIKLASQNRDCRVLAVSQDGPITAVWWEKGAVLVKRVGFLTNMNMPWA